MDQLLARLQSALSHRYDVQRPLGAGGMSFVFLARDLKHDRPVALKVLRPSMAEAAGSERFLREISIASHLSHPNILPLHDSGEAADLLYFVMPYVEGESLRDRLEREKQLPIDEALAITRDVAAGLEFAHQHDVVHRDVKPENIMLTGGRAVIADFGVAVAFQDDEDGRLTTDGMSIGSPTYMSPEQFLEAGEVDGRSDLYSLACVLYEMLAGSPPFTEHSTQALVGRHLSSPAPPLRPVRDTIPEVLEGAILKALAKSRADRFRTVGDFVTALEAAPKPTPSGWVAGRAGSRRKLGVAAAGAGVVAVAIAVTLLTVQTGESLPFVERDFILITDIDNETGDDIFDQSLTRALTVAIDQSTYVNVFPRTRVREALKRMAQEDVNVIDEELALQIAVREHIKAVLSVGISSIGDTYLLTTRLLDPVTGESVESRSARAEGKANVLPALDSLAVAVRSDLGESLRGIRERGVPLERATTGSLDALKLWTRGNLAWGSARYAEARTLYRQAVALDPGFAWAHASLGLADDWLDGVGSGQPQFDTALSLLDRVTERERLLISGLATEGEEAVSNYEAYLLQYPDDRDIWYNLGNALRWVERREESVAAYQRSVEIDPNYAWGHINLGVAQDYLGRHVEAAEAFDRAFESDPDQATNWRGDVNRIAGFAWAKIGDTVRAREHFELLLTRGDLARANGLRSLGLLEMYQGRYDVGLENLTESMLIYETTDEPLSEYRNRLYRATAYAAKGMTAELDAELDSAGVLFREMELGPEWGLSWALHLARRSRIDVAQSILDGWVASGVQEESARWRAELLRGALALARGTPERALPPLEAAASLQSDNVTRPLLARAYHESGQRAEAETLYRQVLSDISLGWEAQEPWLLAHYQLGRVLDDLGRPEEAREMYRRLAEIWSMADDDIPVLRDVHRRLEQN